MNLSEKIKWINNKIKQNKTQYNLDRQIAKISALSPGNVNKHKFLTGKNVLLEKDLLQKAAGLKRFECSPLGTSAAEKQHHKLYNVFKFNNKEEKLKKVVLSQI